MISPWDGMKKGQVIKEWVDSNYSSLKSIVMRFHRLNNLGLTKEDLERTRGNEETVSEGCRVLPLMLYKGVNIDLLDESSLMSSGTMKSIDACLAIAKCLKEGMKKIVLPSGANTGSAFSLYGKRNGIETYFFVPASNLHLMDYTLFDEKLTHLISVEDVNVVKKATSQFAGLLKDKYQLQYNPLSHMNWRIDSSKFRGYFIVEYMIEKNINYQWIVQSVAGAFGPVGIYGALAQFNVPLPKFLGIQQEYNSTLYDLWKGTISEKNEMPLNLVMYDRNSTRNPIYYKNAHSFIKILKQSEGKLIILTQQEFENYLNDKRLNIISLLNKLGIRITIVKDYPLEVAGLMCLFGLLKAIDYGFIKNGTVLCLFTGGVSKANPNRPAQAEYTIKKDENLKQSLVNYW